MCPPVARGEGPRYIPAMIVGLGMDLVEIGRIRAYRERWGRRGLVRLFGEAELEYCLGQADAAASLAARFAAKEAFFKAVGTGWGRGGDWSDVQVLREAGPPRLELSGRAAGIAREVGAAHSHLTLTHTATMAAAMVVLETR